MHGIMCDCGEALPNNTAAQYVNEYVPAMQRGVYPGEHPVVVRHDSGNSQRDETNDCEIPRYLKVLAAGKHFADYEMEGTFGTDCLAFDANVSAQDQVEHY